MNRMKEFLKAGHFPTLLSSFLYFDLSFMVWILLAALGVFISEQFQLDPAQKGFLVSVPLLGGTLLRIPMGLLSDRYGSRRIGLAGLAITMVPLFWAWLGGQHLSEIFAIGLLLGVAGASFAVALPLASRWYPAKYQGLVMGIAGAGNSGSVIAALFAPGLAEMFGWQNVFGLALIPIAAVFIFFFFFAKDSSTEFVRKTPAEYIQLAGSRDALTFCFLYGITFGGFVGLTSFLPIFFYDQYSVDKVTTGLYTSYCIFGASLIRPVGGYLSDKFGGVRVLTTVLALVSLCLLGSSLLLPVEFALPLMIALMLGLGMGNGAVFQLVPLRFRSNIGIATGLVGAFGGLGGFFVPNLLGGLKSVMGSFSAGFIAMACIALTGAAVLLVTYLTVWKNESEGAEELGLEAG